MLIHVISQILFLTCGPESSEVPLWASVVWPCRGRRGVVGVPWDDLLESDSLKERHPHTWDFYGFLTS